LSEIFIIKLYCLEIKSFDFVGDFMFVGIEFKKKMGLQVVWCVLLGLLMSRASGILNGSFTNSELENSPHIRAKIGSSMRPDNCYTKTTTFCENINSTSVGSPGLPPTLWCLGTKLPYTTVSLDLLPSVTSLTEMLVSFTVSLFYFDFF